MKPPADGSNRPLAAEPEALVGKILRLREASPHPNEMTPEIMKLIDAYLAIIWDMKGRFESERNGRAPFKADMPCAMCGAGTIRYWYSAPLVGGMECDTVNCVKLNL